jgi:hypothetical protein
VVVEDKTRNLHTRVKTQYTGAVGHRQLIEPPEDRRHCHHRVAAKGWTYECRVDIKTGGGV